MVAERFDLSRRWAPWSQARRLFLRMFWRWLLNVMFLASIAVVMWSYSTSRVKLSEGSTLSREQKYWYNTFSTGLILFTGLQLDSCFVCMAGIFKWYLLTLRQYDPKLFLRILSCEGQFEVIKMLFSSLPTWKRKFDWKVCGISSMWLLLRLLAQIALAALALTAAVGEPIDAGSLVTRKQNGTASVVVFNPIQLFTRDTPQTPESQIADAQALGITGAGSFLETWSANNITTSIPLAVNSSDGSFSHWTYPLADQPTDFKLESIGYGSIPSGRYIDTAAGCEEAGVNISTIALNNVTGEYDVPYTLGDESSGTFHLPASSFNLTYYAAPNILATADSPAGLRGDMRVVSVNVFWSLSSSDSDTLQSARLYLCSCRISQVYRAAHPGDPKRIYLNDSNSPLMLPDQQARILGGAIGGQPSVTGGRAYGPEEYWGFQDPGPDPDVVSKYYVSSFPAGTLYAMDLLSPRTLVNDVLVPYTGYIVQVKWRFAALVFGLLPAIHFFMILIVLWKTRAVVVRENDPFATTLFLKDVLGHISGGKMLSGEYVADELIESNMVYSWEQGNKEEFITKYLTANYDVQYVAYDRQTRREKKFLEGTYD